MRHGIACVGRFCKPAWLGGRFAKPAYKGGAPCLQKKVNYDHAEYNAPHLRSLLFFLSLHSAQSMNGGAAHVPVLFLLDKGFKGRDRVARIRPYRAQGLCDLEADSIVFVL